MTPGSESLLADRQFGPPTEFIDLHERYMDAPPEMRFEIVREIRQGVRCSHGFPDQGEGCEACDV